MADTIQALMGKNMEEMSEEELLDIVRDGRQSRTALMEIADEVRLSSKAKDKPLPSDLLDLMEEF